MKNMFNVTTVLPHNLVQMNPCIRHKFSTKVFRKRAAQLHFSGLLWRPEKARKCSAAQGPHSEVLHFTFYILHFTFYILHFTFYILHFTFYILLFIFYFYILHFTFYILHFTFYILHFTCTYTLKFTSSVNCRFSKGAQRFVYTLPSLS